MTENLIRDLGDGLVMRHATRDDADALAAFNRKIHGENDWDEKALEDWTRDLVSGDSPTVDPGDIIVVEDTASGEIVSSSCLISQIWAYEGIPFKVGRPELVGTLKEYRRRGLIRQQFEVLHAWSNARGELAQAITGIPYYYRQFGYEMTLALSGGRAGYALHVPELKENEEDPFTFRSAAEEDIAFIQTAYDLGCKRDLISAVRDEAEWRYELAGKRKYNVNRREVYIIEDSAGERVGMFGIPPVKWGHSIITDCYELAPGVAWSAVTPSVIRFLWQKGEAQAKEQNQTQKMFGFWLGEDHPAYTVVATKLPRKRSPYTFYMRVPNLPAFLRTIQPRLEAHLADSAFAQYTGELKLSFYKEGLLLTFKEGRIEHIQPLGFEELEKSQAFFPPLVFLHLVFGHRSMAELHHIYVDCAAKDEESANLMDALFPRKPSHVWPIS